MLCIRVWKKEIGTVAAYSLNGISEILPPVFYIFHPILERKKKKEIGTVAAYSLNGYKLNCVPCFLYFSSESGKKKSVPWQHTH